MKIKTSELIKFIYSILETTKWVSYTIFRIVISIRFNKFSTKIEKKKHNNLCSSCTIQSYNQDTKKCSTKDE